MFVKKSKRNVYAFPRRSQFLGVLGDKKSETFSASLFLKRPEKIS
jgi:hypothetical protein